MVFKCERSAHFGVFLFCLTITFFLAPLTAYGQVEKRPNAPTSLRVKVAPPPPEPPGSKGTVTAESCDVSHVQAAIDLAEDDYTVMVPEGKHQPRGGHVPAAKGVSRAEQATVWIVVGVLAMSRTGYVPRRGQLAGNRQH